MRSREISFITLMLATVLAGCGTPNPVSGFKPIYPESVDEITFFQGSRIRTVTVDSLQPTLSWEPLPSDGLSEPYVSVDLEDLRYELIIWKVVNGERGDIVYRARNLTRNEHRVSEPLVPETVYFWSVRANFSIDGKRRVTEWTISDTPCPDQRDYARYGCGRDFARSRGLIHSTNYLRFKTPAAVQAAHSASRAANPEAPELLYRDGIITDEEDLQRRTQRNEAQARRELGAMRQEGTAAAIPRASGPAPGAGGARRIAMAPPVRSKPSMARICDMDPEGDFRIVAEGIAGVIAVPARLPAANPQLADLWDHRPVESTPNFARVAASPAFADADAVMLVGYHGTGSWACIRVHYDFYLLDRRSGQVTRAKADDSTARQRMGELITAWAGT